MRDQIKIMRFIVTPAALLIAIATICLLDFSPLPPWVARFLADREIVLNAEGAVVADNVKIFSFQYAMWICFYWGIGELLVRWFATRHQEQELKLGFLPEDAPDSPQTMLTVEKIPEIHQRLNRAHRDGYPTRLIRLLGYQFQASKSISLCNELLNTETELFQHEINLNYGVVRYIAWLLPSIGFMGTVWGIVQALDTAMQHMEEKDKLLGFVVGDMSVAFWTTLLALILAALLLFISHMVEGREERMLNSAAQYCVTNMINRFWVP
mgnify:CR=1 FL=1